MRLLVILLVALFIGGFALFYFALDVRSWGDMQVLLGLAEDTETAENTQTASDDIPTLEPVYSLTMGNFRVPVFRRNRVFRHVEVEVILITDHEGKQRFIEDVLPYLRDVYMRELTAYINLQFDEVSESDPGNVKKRLKLVADRTIGKDYVTDVLVLNLFAHRPGT